MQIIILFFLDILAAPSLAGISRAFTELLIMQKWLKVFMR